jgi:hypothetical protein
LTVPFSVSTIIPQRTKHSRQLVLIVFITASL